MPPYRVARRRPAIASVTWRDGVHLTDTSIWCDALRRRDVCFVSSADRVGRVSHGQLIGTPLTLALVGGDASGNLAVPLHQRFTLGTQRLELIASGRGPGAAALFVDRAGKKTLYAGAIRTADGPCEVAEIRTCDTLVVAAPFGEPRHRFPSLANTIARTIAWIRSQLAGTRRPALLVDTVLDGLELATVLSREGLAAAGSRPIRDAARRAGNLLGTAVPPGVNGRVAIAQRGGRSRVTRSGPPAVATGVAIAAPGREPRAVIWLASDREGLARTLRDRPYATALVSGRALGGSPSTDAGFVWPHAADRAQLLAWIEATRAREVFVTGACAETIARAVGDTARVLGPPQQLALFDDHPAGVRAGRGEVR